MGTHIILKKRQLSVGGIKFCLQSVRWTNYVYQVYEVERCIFSDNDKTASEIYLTKVREGVGIV